MRDLWNESWDYEFTIVRNPYERIFSKAKQQAKEFGIDYPDPLGFLRWTKDLLENVIYRDGLGVDDNHFRPQSEFIGKETLWYRLEDQIDKLLDELRRSEIISQDTIFPRINSSFEKSPSIRIPWEDYPSILDKFINLYREDFEKFKYSKRYSIFYSNIL